MRAVHLWVGASVVAGFGSMMLWGVGTWLLGRGPGRAFWWLLTFLQVSLLAQLIIGVGLFVGGGRPPGLHYVYGIVFPALVLGVAHWLARQAFADRPWAPFAIAAFFAFGLTLRALTTGTGAG